MAPLADLAPVGSVATAASELVARTTTLRARVTYSEAEWFAQAAKAKGTTVSEMIRAFMAAEAIQAGISIPQPEPVT